MLRIAYICNFFPVWVVLSQWPNPRRSWSEYPILSRYVVYHLGARSFAETPNIRNEKSIHQKRKNGKMHCAQFAWSSLTMQSSYSVPHTTRAADPTCVRPAAAIPIVSNNTGRPTPRLDQMMISVSQKNRVALMGRGRHLNSPALFAEVRSKGGPWSSLRVDTSTRRNGPA